MACSGRGRVVVGEVMCGTGETWQPKEAHLELTGSADGAELITPPSTSLYHTARVRVRRYKILALEEIIKRPTPVIRAHGALR